MRLIAILLIVSAWDMVAKPASENGADIASRAAARPAAQRIQRRGISVSESTMPEGAQARQVLARSLRASR
jgi:hypothetical protein